MNIKAILLYAVAIFTASSSCYAQEPSKTTIMEWVDKKDWANGLQLTLHSSVNTDSFYRAYHTNKKLWDAAFTFLKDQDLEGILPGKYPIIGEEVFAAVTEAPSKNKEEVKWESHKHYIDLQYIIRGKEMIGVADTSKAIITKPYSVDVINYDAGGTYYTTEAGKFFLFFPNDAHRPLIKVEGYDVVKKIVIKIQVAPTN
ncbi:MAG: YhcH/YjgK/YiaL family protein [Ferruginibacter sp.]